MIEVRAKATPMLAVRYDGKNQAEVDQFIGGESQRADDGALKNNSLAEPHLVTVGDWLVAEAHGVVVYGPDGFDKRYAAL